MSFEKLFLVLLAALVSSLSDARTLHFVTFPIPLMVENSEKGVFIELTKEIAKRNNLQIEIEVLPTPKSILKFSSNKVDSFFPAVGVVTVPKGAVLSEPFYEKIDFIFYRSSHPLLSIKELAGKKVGLTFRYPYSAELTNDKKIHFQYAEDDVTNMKKLGQGDIDAFVVEERSGVKALQLSGVENVEYKKTKPISRQEVYYAFQNTEEGRSLAQRFSKTISALKSAGYFNEVITNHQKTKTLR